MIKTLLNAIRRRLQERQTLLELSSLDDHQLHDIGLIRSQIPTVSHGIVDRQALPSMHA